MYYFEGDGIHYIYIRKKLELKILQTCDLIAKNT